MVGSFEDAIKEGNMGAAARHRIDFWSNQGNSGILKNTDRVLHEVSLITGAGFFLLKLASSVYFTVSDYPLCFEIPTRGMRLKPSKK